MELNRETTNKKTQELHATTGNAEAEVRKVFNSMMDAMRNADVERLMSFYAPDIVAFDCMPPLRFIGKEDYKKTWVEAFEMNSDATDSRQDVHDLKIVANGDIAFAHLIRHDVSIKDGKEEGMWMRATHCFEKQNGRWLVTHEQYSLPVDFKTGKAVMDQGLDSVPKLH